MVYLSSLSPPTPADITATDCSTLSLIPRKTDTIGRTVDPNRRNIEMSSVNDCVIIWSPFCVPPLHWSDICHQHTRTINVSSWYYTISLGHAMVLGWKSVKAKVENGLLIRFSGLFVWLIICYFRKSLRSLGKNMFVGRFRFVGRHSVRERCNQHIIVIFMLLWSDCCIGRCFSSSVSRFPFERVCVSWFFSYCPPTFCFAICWI